VNHFFIIIVIIVLICRFFKFCFWTIKWSEIELEEAGFGVECGQFYQPTHGMLAKNLIYFQPKTPNLLLKDKF
jgi:hypothetical protein